MVMRMQNKSNETDTVCRDESQHGRYIAKVCQVLYLFVSLLSVKVRGKGVEMFESSLPGYSRCLLIDLRRELVTALNFLSLALSLFFSLFLLDILLDIFCNKQTHTHRHTDGT